MGTEVVTLSELLGKPDFHPPKRLEGLCEAAIVRHLEQRQGTVAFPVTTSDLTTLLESKVAELDLYADLSVYGEGVEGLTLFQPAAKPKVKIATSLSETPNENRLRSTLAHEFGHVVLHDPMFQRKAQDSLFDPRHEVAQVSYRDGFSAKGGDLFEYQAWYVCGALLMPSTALSLVVQAAAESVGKFADIYLYSDLGVQVLKIVAKHFSVSLDLARIRLLRTGLLSETEPAPTLF